MSGEILYFDDWGTGSDMIAPTSIPNYPSSSDWSLQDVASGIGGLFDSAVGAYGKVISAQNAADQMAFDRSIKTMQLDATKSIVGIQGDVARTQAQTALANAQRQFTNAQTVGNTGYNNTMLLLTIAGVVIAFMGMRK